MLEVHEPQPVIEESMNKLFTLVAAGGLALSVLGCAEKAPAPKPVTPPENKAQTDETPAPAPTEPAPPTEEKK